MSPPLNAKGVKADAFSEWITERGWALQRLTNPWEIVRYKSGGVVHIVYRTKKDSITWTGQSLKHYGEFLGQGKPAKKAWKARPLKSQSRKVLLPKLRARDGDCCWYCGEFLEDDTTIEHLIPRADGGTHTLANLVLAHQDCNQAAADAPLANKIVMQAEFARKRATTPPWVSIR